MYILNITNTMKQMTVNEIRDFILENYYKRIGFSKENSYYTMNDPCNFNKYYQLFIRKKNTKSVKE